MSSDLPNQDDLQNTPKGVAAAVRPALRKRARRMSGTRRFAVGIAVWGLGVTLFAGIQTARIGTLEKELHDLPQTMAALESRVAARAVAVEQRQQELQTLLSHYNLIMDEDPRAPELLERRALMDRGDELDAEGHAPPSGGPFDSEADDDTPVNRSEHPAPTPRPTDKEGNGLVSLGASVLGMFETDEGNSPVRAIVRPQLAALAAPTPITLPHVPERQWSKNVTPAHARNWTEVKVGSLADDLEQVSALQNFLIDGMVTRLDETIERRASILNKTGADLSDVLENAGVVEGGMGGPYIPAELEEDHTDSRDAYLLERLQTLAALNDVLTLLPIRRPVAEDRAYISSHYGRRRDPIRRRYALHAGLDLAGGSGTTIMATAEGTVVRAGRAGPYGNLVEIDHGNGIHTRYAHLRSINVVEGEVVAVGQKVGRMGTTGRSTGTHLHYEIWVDGGHVDPLPFIQVGGDVARDTDADS